MGIRDRMIERFFGGAIERYLAGKAVASYPHWALSMANVESTTEVRLDLPQRQAELYQRLSWVAIAVGHVAKESASVPLGVLREQGEDTSEEVNHPFEQLLKRPNPRRSRYELLEASFLYYQLTGNAYWWLNKASENAPPDEVWVIPSHRIEPVPDGQMYIKGYLYDPGNGQKIPLESWEIVHFKRFNPFSAYIGMSPIEALATVAIGDLAMQKWNTNFFADDNAKLPGALTFADPIKDADWAKLKDEVREKHGGTARNLMMLRGTGEGGVKWVSMAMTQKEMEFLQARRFNQSEIYDLYAPGLTQWLSPDTTTANARSGRDAFFELAIYPLHTAFGETISNAILPLYGENLIAQFDDVRPKDRALILQEQQAFAQVHTVDEIRERYYSADPIGDERGLLLPKEIGSGGGGGGGNPFDVSMPGPDIIEPVEETKTAEPKQAAEKERDQFRAFAEWRVKKGRPEEIDNFRFEHLDKNEQAALKAEYQPNELQTLATRLEQAIDVLRESEYADHTTSAA